MDDNTRWLRNNFLLTAKYCIKADEKKKEERNKLIRNVPRQQQRAWQSPEIFLAYCAN